MFVLCLVVFHLNKKAGLYIYYLCKRVTPRSVLLAPSTRGVLLPTLRQTHVIAGHMDTSSVDRVLLLPMRHIEEGRRLG
jgi:hypothetical protein